MLDKNITQKFQRFSFKKEKKKEKKGKIYRSLKACPITFIINILCEIIVTIYNHYCLQSFSGLGRLSAVLTTNLCKILKDM